MNSDIKNNKLWLSYPTNRAERPENEGAFHATRYSGLKFRVFHVTRGTVFSHPSQVITHQVSHENTKQTKRKQTAEFLPLLPDLLSLELHDESEVETNDVLDADDNNRAHDYSECTIPRYFPDEFKCHFRMTRQAVHSRGHTGHIARIAYMYFGLTF